MSKEESDLKLDPIKLASTNELIEELKLRCTSGLLVFEYDEGLFSRFSEYYWGSVMAALGMASFMVAKLQNPDNWPEADVHPTDDE